MKKKWCAVVAAAALTLGPLAACSDQGVGATPADAAGQQVEQPFAIFRGASLGAVDYAQLKVLNQCLADKGYPQNLQVMLAAPRNPFPQLIVTEKTFGPASEEEARRDGFGQDEPAIPPSVVSFDPNYDRASEQCSEDAWKKLSANAKKVYYSYFDLGNSLSMPFHLTVNERMGRARWTKLLSCLADKGYRTNDEDAFYRFPDPGLFGVPIGAGAEDPAASWTPKGVPGTVEVGPATPARKYRPSAQESDLAVAWFRCRRDTGIAKDQMDLVMQVQRGLVAKNESELTELNPQIEQIAKQAATLIGQA
ncbi:hypothetical protein [Actinoplanes sp. NPDC049118]|uniref:hypothetical protein n=1 Tax=Actinoplanes sp. NPDC049118 TaxID=3155769 RepID=UPI0033DEE4BB